MVQVEKARLKDYHAKTKDKASQLSAEDQLEMEAAVGPASRAESAADQTFLAFQLRVARAGDQVLRYRLGGPPLWAGRQYRECRPCHVRGSTEVGKGSGVSVPPCGRCGGARQFEFQVQPQLLHYLCKDKTGGCTSGAVNMEWGMVAVYTCSRSCELDHHPETSEQAYAEEWVWRQPGQGLQPGKTVFSEKDPGPFGSGGGGAVVDTTGVADAGAAATADIADTSISAPTMKTTVTTPASDNAKNVAGGGKST